MTRFSDVCLSVSLSRTSKSIEWCCNSMIKMSKVKVTGNENPNIIVSRISSSKVDWYTSNQCRNDHRPILHISLNTLHQQKRIIFRYLSVLGIVFIYSSKKTKRHFPSSLPYLQYSAYIVAQLPKIGGCRWYFFRQRSPKFLIWIFLKFT